MGARYYDPLVGRFISEDPACNGINWYVYCNNNPINTTDSTGMFLDLLLTELIGLEDESAEGAAAQAELFLKELSFVTLVRGVKYLWILQEIILKGGHILTFDQIVLVVLNMKDCF